MNKITSYVVSGAVLVVASVSPAFAAADVTAITAAQTDILAYVAAILAVGIAIWAAMKPVKFFGGK